MKINVTKLLENEKLELAAKLIKCRYTVRLVSGKENGKNVSYIEYSMGEQREEKQ